MSFRFRDACSTTRRLGVMFAMCTVTNPTSAAPEYWAPLNDDEEGRRELARRVRMLFQLDNPSLHGDHGAHMLKTFALKELANV
jgi:hypothetical protein